MSWICGWCEELIEDDNWNEVVEDGHIRYHHNSDWSIPGGTCLEKRICEDLPELEPWLYLSFECDGCIPTDEGDCSCTNGF